MSYSDRNHFAAGFTSSLLMCNRKRLKRANSNVEQPGSLFQDQELRPGK